VEVAAAEVAVAAQRWQRQGQAQRRQQQRSSGDSTNDFFSDQGSISNFFSD
jgi:hypothetical protein